MLINLTWWLEKSFCPFFAKTDVQAGMIIYFQNPAFQVFIDQNIESNDLEAFTLRNLSFKNLRLFLLRVRRVGYQRCTTNICDFFKNRLCVSDVHVFSQGLKQACESLLARVFLLISFERFSMLILVRHFV